MAADPLHGFGYLGLLSRKVDKYEFEPGMPSLSIGAMRSLWFLLSVVVALHSAVDATSSKERRSILDGTFPTILTPDFVETVQEIVDAGGVPGLTLAIVYESGPAELGAWGIRSENGTNMTTDVR
jgi:hypothetical protein